MNLDRRLAFAAFLFLAFLLSLSAAVHSYRQGSVDETPPQDLVAQTADLHALVSGSLFLSGLHSEDILHEESFDRDHANARWREYRQEILVDDDFPLNGWFDGLEASLQRAGARLESIDLEGHREVSVLYPVPGRGEEILVDSLKVEVRPGPEVLTRHRVENGMRAVLVIDDLGQNPAHLRRLLDLKLPLTVSVLPYLPYSETTARKAIAEGLEVLLHIPMEPFDYPEKHPGPGALLLEMTDEQLGARLGEDLDSLPGVTGVNNHMGSRLTADRHAMELLMAELRARGLFFLDSKTSARSVAFETAFRFNVPTVARDIFLDAHDDRDFVRGQVLKVLDIARRHGAAIGIGHPYESTLSVLEEMRQELVDSGVEWVHLSDVLVRPEVLEVRRDGPAGSSPTP